MSSERDAELQRKHAQSVGKLLDAAFPGVGVGKVFQTQVEAAQRRGSVTASVINAEFEDWWEREGLAFWEKALVGSKELAHRAWLEAAVHSAQLDRGQSDPYISTAQAAIIAYADAEAKAQAERREVVP
jgi:hypothetical protein